LKHASNVSSAKSALKHAQEKLEEEERKGKEMRAKSDKRQKEYRDKRLFKLNVLTF
jgi:hypothetical protein